MKVTLAYIGARSRNGLLDPATNAYLERISHYATVELAPFRDEAALFASIEKIRSRTPVCLVILDSRGEQWSSENLAKWLGARRDAGQQTIVFAVGPASGWSAAAATQAQVRLSLGKMTLPHELARLVLAEQLYRAFTILAGHPYHIGH